MKVFMLPGTNSNLGIGRVTSAYRRGLPEYGIEFVNTEAEADVVSVHASFQSSRQPDILHCHGLYPTAKLDNAQRYYTENAQVISNARLARTITVPSSWVAELFQRDMLIDPFVVRHGINLDEFKVGASDGYVLWGKGHISGVIDPSVVGELATRMPDVKFVTTFGRVADNVLETGKLPYARMKKCIGKAGVYLATTKETFGIQTLEAMASGVPVVGYDHGATPGIVGNDSGIMVRPGDVDGLVEAIYHILSHHKLFSNASRARAEEFSWDKVMPTIANLYLALVAEKPVEPRVSVIIPCYNYAKLVHHAIESVLNQRYDGNVEIIVVDDGSPDNTREVVGNYLDGVRYIRIANSGVAGARNAGIKASSGDFIVCLDADDEMGPDFLSTLVPALRADRGLGIAYGGLVSMVNGKIRPSTWPEKFNYSKQLKGKNNVPSACLFRRKAWSMAGGYRGQYTPAEDADLWLRIATIGYGVKKVTDKPLYTYRVHADSLSRTKTAAVDWAKDKPWGKHPLFAAPGARQGSYPVRNYDKPYVSVVIPVGPGHETHVFKAIDALMLQTMPYWEVVVVVNTDANKLLHPSTGLHITDAYPFARLEYLLERNVAKARNMGARAARGDFLVWNDADDWLLPNYLERVIDGWNADPDNYIYTDWYGKASDGVKIHRAKEFSCSMLKQEALHPITTFLPKKWHEDMGGFDEGLSGWEDWDYYLKIAYKHCGVRLNEPLMVYDYSAGHRREESMAQMKKLLPIITGRYKNMPCKNCGGKIRSVPAPSRIAAPPVAGSLTVFGAQKPGDRDMVEVIENSGNHGAHTVVGVRTKKRYGRHKHGDVFHMHSADQAGQPAKYVLTRKVAPTYTERAYGVGGVLEDSGAPVSTPSMQYSPAVIPQAASVAEMPQVDATVGANVDVEGDFGFEVDLCTLDLQQIIHLGLDTETCAEALEVETETCNRADVIAYLESEIMVAAVPV